jgi:hypothetical protein
MTTARDLIVDQSAAMVESGARLTTWYAQGHADGLGDRLLMFDNTSAPSWEILRFKPALARDARFEIALRQRMERLHSFEHPAFPTVRSIKELGHEEGLAVVSTYVTGVRLSDALKKPRSVEFALQLVRQLMPALSALHEHGQGVAHGAVTLDRVVLTSDGRLMIREHMLGSALESLELPGDQLWADYGIPSLPSRVPFPSLDSRTDVAQLALVALSLIAGRRIGPGEFPHSIHELLERVVPFEPFRHWLARALQINERAFRSAREASEALTDLRRDPQSSDDSATLRLSPAPADRPEPAPPSPPRVAERPHPLAPTGVVATATPRRFGRAIRWAAIAAVVVAIGEAAFIGRLLYVGAGTATGTPATTVLDSPPRTAVPANEQPPRATPLAATVEGAIPGLRVLPAVADAGPKPPDVRPATTGTGPVPVNKDVPAATAARSGGFRVSSPIELYVLDGDRVLGSSGEGPIMARAGRHELEFVNSVIGFRTRREVDVRAGQITSVAVTVPNGTLNINATPWAAVWIDGAPFGETPLGNVSIVPGEHEIVFRHPQLGERRETIIVRPDVPGRVAVNLQR